MKRTKAAAFILAIALTFLCASACFAEEEKPILIAHGGGSIKGYETTNSVEAVMQSIADGYKLIELDFDFSRDDKLIMIHDWDRTAVKYFGVKFDKKLSEQEFEKILINGQFHTLTLKKLIKILDEAQDIRIVTDVKNDNIRALSMIAEKYPGYIDRFIPQIYSYEQYDSVKELGYSDIILTLYAMENLNYAELMGFIDSHDLFAVTAGSEHDYAIKELKYKLAGDGVCVYYHPVNDFETAERALRNGVHGVYSNIIVPADFDEPTRAYYLLEEKVKLQDLELFEKSFKCLKNVKIKNGAIMERTYLINGVEVFDGYIESLPEGKHELKLILTLDEKTIAELDYFLWADEGLRVLDKRYEYRLDEKKKPLDLLEAFDSLDGVCAETRDLLQNSLIVKAGEYYGYCDGELLIFQADEEFLHTRKYINGSVISPFADCIKAVGADSVLMDEGRYIYAFYNGKRTMMQANTAFISQGLGSSRLATPLTIFRDKTMAAGEVYNIITGREYIDNQEIMILLPENVKTSEISEDILFETASVLFQSNTNFLQTDLV